MISARSMGYMRFECVGKDYEAGHFLILLIPINLSSCQLFRLERNDGRETGIFSNSTFILIYFVEGNVFSKLVKIALILVEVCINISERVSFQLCIDCRSCRRGPGRLFWVICIYLFFWSLFIFNVIGLVCWLIVLFYGVLTLFGSFNAESNFKQFTLV